MPWLADSGILLRMSQPDSPIRERVQRIVEHLIVSGERVFVNADCGGEIVKMLVAAMAESFDRSGKIILMNRAALGA